jgi:hypothetical protein
LKTFFTETFNSTFAIKWNYFFEWKHITQSFIAVRIVETEKKEQKVILKGQMK